MAVHVTSSVTTSALSRQRKSESFIPPLRSLRSLWLKTIPRARPHSVCPPTFGVAGFIRGVGLPCPQIPAGLRARPIGHWQHWNWQHFHIGNIFLLPKNFLCAALRHAVRFDKLVPSTRQVRPKRRGAPAFGLGLLHFINDEEENHSLYRRLQPLLRPS